jgi:hypothetical protein
MHCAKKGDLEVIEAVCHLLHDSSFAIRMAAVSALSVFIFESQFELRFSAFSASCNRLVLKLNVAGSIESR